MSQRCPCRRRDSPTARKIITPANVTAITDTITDPTLDQMLANGTDFEFDEPIYLAPLTEYAIVLITPSMKYRTYISRVEDFVLGSTENVSQSNLHLHHSSSLRTRSYGNLLRQKTWHINCTDVSSRSQVTHS